MVDYSSDEERFSAIVDFFKRNRNSFLLIFLVIFSMLVIVIGFRSYQANQNAQASELYDLWLLEMSNENIDSEKTLSTFNSLQEKFPKTGYAQLARMSRGSQFARDGNLDVSLGDFKELLHTSSGLFGNHVLNSLARISIARIELNNENYEKVLEVLDGFSSDSEHPVVYEIKGDALIGLDKKELALDQYSLAMANMQDESQKSLLKIKINKVSQ